MFAGVSGTTDSTGSLTGGVYALTGSGSLSAPELVSPEPQSMLLVFGGLALFATRLRKPTQR